jgi:hypothetical protein
MIPMMSAIWRVQRALWGIWLKGETVFKALPEVVDNRQGRRHSIPPNTAGSTEPRDGGSDKQYLQLGGTSGGDC